MYDLHCDHCGETTRIVQTPEGIELIKEAEGPFCSHCGAGIAHNRILDVQELVDEGMVDHDAEDRQAFESEKIADHPFNPRRKDY